MDLTTTGTPPLASSMSNVEYVTVVGNNVFRPVVNSTYINEFTAMTVPAFYSGIRFISETLASFTSGVHHPDEGYVAGHPVTNLLNRNISTISIPYRTKQAWYYHATVWGNGYLWIRRDAFGKPIGLYNLNPELTHPIIIQDQKFYVVGLGNQNKIALPDTDVLHIALLGYDGLQGYPLVYLMREALGLSKAAERHSSQIFRKGTMLRGAVEVPGAMTDKQLATMQESLRNFQGNEGQEALSTMILQAGAKLNNSTMPNDTAQLIETRRWSVIEVAQMLRLAPHILYELSHGKWNSVEQLGAEVVKYSLGPWIVQTEQEQTLKLLTTKEINQGLTIRIQTGSLTRSDEKTLSTQVLAEVNGGLKTLNEGRAEIGLPSVGPEGDKLRVPVSFPTAPAGGKGTTTGTTPAPSEEIPPTDEDKEQPDYRKVIEPLLFDAITRVDAKTDKAFANREGKELTIWANVFAEEQLKYVHSALKPVAEAAVALGISLDVGTMAQRYASAIRKRAATSQKETLQEMVKHLFHGEATKSESV